MDEAKLRVAERRASEAEELLAAAVKQKDHAVRLLQQARERSLQSEKEVGRLQEEKVALEMEIAGRPAAVSDVGALQREVVELRSQLAISRAASVRSEKGLEDLRKLLPPPSREASAGSEISLIRVRDTKTQEERIADAMADKKSKYDCVWATSFPERFDMHGYEAMVENTTKPFDLGRHADVATAIKEVVKVLLPTRSIESKSTRRPECCGRYQELRIRMYENKQDTGICPDRKHTFNHQQTRVMTRDWRVAPALCVEPHGQR